MATPASIVIVSVGILFILSNLLVNLIEVEVFTDAKTFQLMGKEHALLIANHKSDIDWLVGWVLAQRAGSLGSALAIMKKSSQYHPLSF